MRLVKLKDGKVLGGRELLDENINTAENLILSQESDPGTHLSHRNCVEFHEQLYNGL